MEPNFAPLRNPDFPKDKFVQYQTVVAKKMGDCRGVSIFPLYKVGDELLYLGKVYPKAEDKDSPVKIVVATRFGVVVWDALEEDFESYY